MWIVIIGTPINGFSFHGPFSSEDEAEVWADVEDQEWWVVELASPDGEARAQQEP